VNLFKVTEDRVHCYKEVVKGGWIATEVSSIDISHRHTLERSFVCFYFTAVRQNTYLFSREGGDEFVPPVVSELNKQRIKPSTMNVDHVTAGGTLIDRAQSSVGNMGIK